MGMYDPERDMVVEFPNYFAHCPKCGKEGLKKENGNNICKARNLREFLKR